MDGPWRPPTRWKPAVFLPIPDRPGAITKADLRNWLPPALELERGEAGGVTNFDFGRGGVTFQEIHVEGWLVWILASDPPHEITHTIFAAFLGGPMPRWADEGSRIRCVDQPRLHPHSQIQDKLEGSTR